MKRYGFLWDKIVSFSSLMTAARLAARGKSRRPDVARFMFDCENQVIKLETELNTGVYRPNLFSIFHVKDPKERMICAADFRDRVVHHALCAQLEPVFERVYIYDSYACRKNKGTHKAIAKTQSFSHNHCWFLKCDIRKYFDTVDHAILKTLLHRKIKDKKTRGLSEQIINHTAPHRIPGKGLPIGNLTSQHFANFYLNQLDHFVKDDLRVKGYIRYMDDFILFDDHKDVLQNWLHRIADFLRKNLILTLKTNATIIAPVSNGIPFLGFRIYPRLIRIKRENLKRSLRKLGHRERQYGQDRIGFEKLVQSASSIIAHISHADSLQLRRRLFYKSECEG
jgi:RNA-directed DNA polymerase